MIEWSEWYVIHKQGRGLRVKVKDRSTAVHGGAGSVSQMISAPYHLYEKSTQNGISVIRFHPTFVMKNQWILEGFLSLEDYELKKKLAAMGEGQQTLEDW